MAFCKTHKQHMNAFIISIVESQHSISVSGTITYIQYENDVFLQSMETRNVMLTLTWKRSAALGSVCFIMQTLSSFNKPRSSSTILLRQAQLSPLCKHTHAGSVVFCIMMNMFENAEHVGLKGCCFVELRGRILRQGCNRLCPRVYKRTQLITEQSTAQHS